MVSKKEIREKAIRNGILLGLILLAVMKVLPTYVIASSSSFWLVIPLPIIATYVISPLIAAYFSYNLRIKLGGYWAFRQATTGIFFMFFSAFVIFSIGNYAFDQLAGPSVNSKMKNNLIVATSKAMQHQGADQKAIAQRVRDIEKQFTSRQHISIGSVIQGIAFSIIFVFVAALIFAAIFKKEPPYFTSPPEG